MVVLTAFAPLLASHPRMSDSQPPNVTPSDAPNPAPPAPMNAGTGLQPNVAAGLASIFTLIGGIVFLVLEKRDKFVRFYAMQSVFLGGAMVAASVVTQIVAIVFSHLPIIGWLIALLFGLLFWLLWLGWFVVYVITIIKAFSNQEWEIPFLGPLARKQLESGRLGSL